MTGKASTMISTKAYQAFFRRYQVFMLSVEQESEVGWGAFCGRVRTSLPQLLKAVRSEEAQVAPDFNIFRTLGLERLEEAFHTPMLAYLLDPSATHSQGSLFLKAFFNMLHDRLRRKGCSVPPLERLDEGQWAVRREFYIGGSRKGGRLDLLIENARNKYIVVIENKIATDDSPDQLQHYYDWLTKHRSDYQWRELIYLTPDGRYPKYAKCKCLRLSYAKDISTFLNAAMKDVKAPAVRMIVRQYLVLLGSLAEEDDDEVTEEVG